MTARHIPIGALIVPTGLHPASWLISSAPERPWTNLNYYRDLAALAESGMLDFFFIADTPAARTENLDIYARNPAYMNCFEPLTLLSCLAASTRNIGLAATASTSFFEPYNLARQFASLDHLSGGRAGWNVVTSANDFAARNFGHEKLPPHAERYKRAREFFAVASSLWDTWDEGAFIADKENVKAFDTSRFHKTDYQGDFFKVYGGLNIERSPQGRPVIIQAGSSADGRAFASETAEVIFSSEPTIPEAQAFYADIKARARAAGRSDDSIKILAGLSVIVGESEAEARDKYQELQNLIHPDIGVMKLSADLETDLRGLPLDEPIPEHLIPTKANQHQGYFKQIVAMIRERRLTLRQLYSTYERGKVTLCGTAPQIVDHMEAWVGAGATDGFMLSCHVLPDDLTSFVDKIVPEMQKRGLMRTQYQGRTFRENLGLPVPTRRTSDS